MSDAKSVMKKKKVLVLYVGGTFGMKRNKDYVLSPPDEPNLVTDHMKLDRELNDYDFGQKHFGVLKNNELVLPEINETALQYLVKEYKPLLDSSNMGVDDWIRLAKDITSNYENYDGFVIIHGTDTLCYTASALSFMLEGIQKPVIFTSAHMPIFEMRSDARENFQHSLILAGCYNIPEVCVFFSSKLMRANRTVKISNESFDGFESFNYHTLGNTGMYIDVHRNYLRKVRDERLKLHTNLNTKVAILKFCPTVTAAMVGALLKSPIEALVMQTYGKGNLPMFDTELMAVLEDAIERGIIIVNITQCLHGTVSTSYETGSWLSDMGIANGKDMTCEAAVTKLCYILGLKNLTYQEKVKMIETDLRGEMSIM